MHARQLGQIPAGAVTGDKDVCGRQVVRRHQRCVVVRKRGVQICEDVMAAARRELAVIVGEEGPVAFQRVLWFASAAHIADAGWKRGRYHKAPAI